MEIQQDANQSVKVPFYKKMKKSNFITAIVAFSVIGVLILTTILLAVIPTYTGVKFDNSPDRIVLKINSTQLTLYADVEETRDDFNRVWNAYNNASSPTVMDAIFNGYAGKGKTANYSASSKSYSNLATTDTFSVAFYWDENQLMTDANGSAFKYALSNGQTSIDEVYYKAATFAVSATNSVEEKTFYLRRSTALDTSTSTNYYYTGIANYHSLYNVLNALQDEGKFTVYN